MVPVFLLSSMLIAQPAISVAAVEPRCVAFANTEISDAPPPLFAIEPVLPEPPPRIEPRLPHEGNTRRMTVAIAGIYAGAFAIMWNLPDETTNWEKDDMGERFLDAFSRAPVWDEDEWVTNWVLHPWWGMWVYQTERNYGESPLRSFLVATAHSVAFEYIVEAWTENPSIQDLLSTSPIGALMGELVHRWIQRAGRDGFSRWERVTIDLLNPAYRWQIGFLDSR